MVECLTSDCAEGRAYQTLWPGGLPASFSLPAKCDDNGIAKPGDLSERLQPSQVACDELPKLPRRQLNRHHALGNEKARQLIGKIWNWPIGAVACGPAPRREGRIDGELRTFRKAKSQDAVHDGPPAGIAALFFQRSDNVMQRFSFAP